MVHKCESRIFRSGLGRRRWPLQDCWQTTAAPCGTERMGLTWGPVSRSVRKARSFHHQCNRRRSSLTPPLDQISLRNKQAIAILMNEPEIPRICENDRKAEATPWAKMMSLNARLSFNRALLTKVDFIVSIFEKQRLVSVSHRRKSFFAVRPRVNFTVSKVQHFHRELLHRRDQSVQC